MNVRPLLFLSVVALAGSLSGVAAYGAQATATPPPGVITGIVRDESGTPVVGAVVQAVMRRKKWAGAYYETPIGRPDESNDRGQFRLHSLPPASNIVVVALPPVLSRQPAAPLPAERTEYVRTYSPDATALADARPIVVGPGSELSVSVRLARVHFVSVSGIAMTSGGEPASNCEVTLRGGPATVGYSGVQIGYMTTLVAGTQVANNGSFTLSRVPAGSYVLTVTNGHSRRRPDQPFEFAEIPVEVKDASLNGLTVTTAPGATVSGRLEWRGDGPVPWPRDASRLGRIRATGLGRDTDFGGLDTEIQPDGTFRFLRLYGLRRIVSMGLAFNWTIIGVEGPKDLMVGPNVNVTPGRDITDLRVLVTNRFGTLVATVTDEDDKPFAGGSILLMSPDPTDLDAMRWGFRATLGYSAQGDIWYHWMEQVVPGPYLVAAIDIEPHRLRDDSELMVRARAGAVPVDVREGQQTQLNVRLVRLRSFVQNP